MKIVELPSKGAADKLKVGEELFEALERTRKGEIEAIMLTLRTADGYEYVRVGFTYLEAIAMLDRHKHALHTSWDREP